MNRLQAGLLSLITALVATPVMADEAYICRGKVTYYGVEANGDVVVRLGTYPVHRVCNLNGGGPWIPTGSVCKQMAGSILSAKLTDQAVALYYRANGMTCSTMPEWGTVPTMYFVQGPEAL